MRISFITVCLLVLTAFTAQADSARFVDKKNGTVLDTETGLLWQKQDSYHELKKGMNWYEALEYVAAKNSAKFAGFNDWRLPTLEEFHQIWDRKRPNTSKDGDPIGLPAPFAGGGSYYLWTSTERSLDNVWYFGLGQREDYFNLKDLGD
ncbi:MAG: DUF1566 domain-containing protein, partial [Nitrospinaceae bacterium]|nr:DUF1566 domain-containing protein [Nitrospinaceae bacterium]NIR57299.1 DUF1566 domain-containing protein [Nitrospinaceae bacterium]NIS87751.1 DUF1566 domain-containing protein [Nitrospinaceae bacterium]NIT84621.1 DUF1566 domain-containing protein [Nitrospinaceae bacterium]NIU46800.1 DUF1566 domain-containing protein [Nitrospinaceae bacterium]